MPTDVLSMLGANGSERCSRNYVKDVHIGRRVQAAQEVAEQEIAYTDSIGN